MSVYVGKPRHERLRERPRFRDPVFDHLMPSITKGLLLNVPMRFNNKILHTAGGGPWLQVAPKLGAETHIYSLAVYNGKLYGGTAPNGKLYEWNGTDAWVEVAPKLGAETHIYSLAVYNGKLYGGTAPNGKLYEWTVVHDALSTETVSDKGTVKNWKDGLLDQAIANVARTEREGWRSELTRTNLCLQSEDLTTTWTDAGATPTADQTTAPDDTSSADKVTKASADSNRRIWQGVAATAARYAFSFYIKAGTFTSCAVGILDGTWQTVTASILSGPGSVTGTSQPVVSGLSTTQWTRVQLVSDGNLSTNAQGLSFYPGGTGTGGSGDYLYLWGVQFELGLFASSYMPTTTASVERPADSLHIDNTGQVHCKAAQGTIFIVAMPDFNAAENPNNATVFSTRTGTDGLDIMHNTTSKKWRALVRSGGASEAELVSSSGASRGVPVVLTLAWGLNDCRFYTNGADEQSDTVCAAPTTQGALVRVGQNHSAAGHFGGNVKHLLIYDWTMPAGLIKKIVKEDYGRWMPWL